MYRWLLLVFPKPFRHRFGAEMARHFEGRFHDARRRGIAAVLTLCVRTLVDVAVHGFAERRERQSFALMWSSFSSDMRSGFRALRARPGYSAGIMTMLALGIGFNVALYAVVESALLRPLPFTDAARLVFVWQGLWPDGQGRVNSYADFEDFRARSRAFTQMTAYNINFGTLVEEGVPEQIYGAIVTTDFFQVIGRTAALGRVLAPGDETVGGNQPVVIAHSLWTRRFAQNPAVIDRTIDLGGESMRIVGVMPADFEQPEPFWDETTEYWVPMAVTDDMRTARASRYLRVLGRLKPEATIASAQAEAAVIGDGLRTQHGDLASPQNPVLRTVFDELVGHTGRWLGTCAIGALLVLALAIGNIVNLLLAETSARRRELSVRAALGAGRRRLARLLVAESLMLSLGGGLAGVGLASLVLSRVLPLATELVRVDHARVDTSVWLFALLLALLVGLVCGLWPAMRMTGTTLMMDLAGSRGATGTQVSRSRRWLIAAEMALAVPLIVGAALMAVTLRQLLHVDTGFDPAHAVHFRVNLPFEPRYQPGASRTAFVADLESRLRALPGVTAAGVVSSLPMGGLNNTGGQFQVERTDGTSTPQSAGFRAASAGYFDALGIRLRRGRLFTDAPDDVRSVVINERMAEASWGAIDPIGRTLKYGAEPNVRTFTVVGVVGDVKHTRLTDAATPEVFWPYRSQPWSTISVVMRASNPQSVLPLVRPTVQAIDSRLPVVALAAVDDVISERRGPATFAAIAGGVFGVIAIALSAFGTFAVLSLLVRHRTREIGIRVALGATRAQVRIGLLRDALVPALAGCATGGVLAAWLARVLSARVYGIDAQSPAVLAAAIGALTMVALLATWVPARRATRIDPVITLRSDV